MCIELLISTSCVAGDKYSVHKQCTNRTSLMTVSAAALGKGGGLLEKPTIEKTMPGRESEFDLRYRLYSHTLEHIRA